jgi:cell division protein FtsW (lipid II flippase)
MGTGYRTHRVSQLLLVLLGQVIGYGGYLLTSLNRDDHLPQHWELVGLCWFGLGIATAIVCGIAIPHADPLLLSLVFALTGLGLAQIHRIDLDSEAAAAPTQVLAVGIGVVILVLMVFLIKDPRRLQGFPFLLSGLGVVLLLLPLIPGLGVEVYGSRIWIAIGTFSFQPAELAKLVLAASFAAYLTEKREVLAGAGKRFLGLEFPRMRDLGPVMIMWVVSLAIMVFENDLGTSLLFFGLFIVMVYIATGKASWVVLGMTMFAAGCVVVFTFVAHAKRRLDFWLHPFDYPDTATQIIQAQFGFSHGGLLGSGWGLGRPTLIIFARSDMISAALGEEIGIVGLMGIIVLYGLLVFRGLRAALTASDPFLKLFASGLSFAFLLQTFAIIGGVTRLLPLTGLTTPFLSQGGSSMVTNWILAALLLIVSHQARKPSQELGPTTATGATDLENETTQVISAKELVKIGATPLAQAHLTPAGSESTDENCDAGNNEATEVIAPTASTTPSPVAPPPPPTHTPDAASPNQADDLADTGGLTEEFDPFELGQE